MQDGADREHKQSILAESVRNLRKSGETGKMWFIDNESGLFDAYELLYKGPGGTGKKFIEYHNSILHTMCIFRENVVNLIEKLSAQNYPHTQLLNFAKSRDPLLGKLPDTPEHKLFKGYFHTRLKEAVNWINTCRSR